MCDRPCRGVADVDGRHEMKRTRWSPSDVRDAAHADFLSFVAFCLALGRELERHTLDRAAITRGIAQLYTDPHCRALMARDQFGEPAGMALVTGREHAV